MKEHMKRMTKFLENWLSCHYCGKPGHYKQDCRKWAQSQGKVGTPVNPGSHLMKTTEEEDTDEPRLYQSLVGSLMYLSVCTRPDLAYSVSTLAKFSSKPNKGCQASPEVSQRDCPLWHCLYKV